MTAQDHTPDRLGPYRLLERLGEGGMGVVYLAADQQQRRVAVKALRPAIAADPNARRRLAREVETMRRVRSPFVAEVLDADVTSDPPYIVTRYVSGRTLEDVVGQDGPLTGAQLARVASGLALALSAVHAAGVVHRDLKPGNVMIANGEPVVIDFGIAQVPDSTRLTQTGMFMGTPGYLAPEVIEGKPERARLGRALLGSHGGVRRDRPPAVRHRGLRDDLLPDHERAARPERLSRRRCWRSWVRRCRVTRPAGRTRPSSAGELPRSTRPLWCPPRRPRRAPCRSSHREPWLTGRHWRRPPWPTARALPPRHPPPGRRAPVRGRTPPRAGSPGAGDCRAGPRQLRRRASAGAVRSARPAVGAAGLARSCGPGGSGHPGQPVAGWTAARRRLDSRGGRHQPCLPGRRHRGRASLR